MDEQAINALHARLAKATGGSPARVRDALRHAHSAALGLLGAAGVEAAAEAMTAGVLATMVADAESSPGFERRLVGEAPTSPALVRTLVGEAHHLTGAQPARVALLALGDPGPLEFPLHVTLQAHATLLAGLTGAHGVAIWRLEDDAALELAAYAGAGDPYGTRESAQRVIDGEAGAASEDAVVIQAFGEFRAILAWLPGYGAAGATRALAEHSARLLALAFERAAMLDGTVAQHSALARAAERRLSRVAFDLHDGPMQDIALLCGELKLLGATLVGRPAAGSQKRDPAELVQDALGIAEAASNDLRDLATSMESSKLLKLPFPEALRAMIRAFALRSGIEPELALEGDVDALSNTARMTLLRVIGEALTNVREHGQASAVKIAVRASGDAVEASVNDNGRGFDVQSTLPEAARRGRLGLLGMIERARLIEGSCRVYSQPGIGTTVALAFSRVSQDDELPVAPDAEIAAAPAPVRRIAAA